MLKERKVSTAVGANEMPLVQAVGHVNEAIQAMEAALTYQGWAHHSAAVIAEEKRRRITDATRDLAIAKDSLGRACHLLSSPNVKITITIEVDDAR